MERAESRGKKPEGKAGAGAGQAPQSTVSVGCITLRSVGVTEGRQPRQDHACHLATEWVMDCGA